MRARFIGVGLALGLCCSVPAAATPVQWSFSGSVTGATNTSGGAILSALYPIGTPVSFFLSFDTLSTNYAINPATQGFYEFPGGQITILGQTYLSQFFTFEINCPAGNCASGPGQLQEVFPLIQSPDIRLVDFAGAPFHSATIGASGVINYTCVVCADGLQFDTSSETYTVLPEPASFFLLSTGVVAVAAFRRFKQR
jgi:hypothetical protein